MKRRATANESVKKSRKRPTVKAEDKGKKMAGKRKGGKEEERRQEEDLRVRLERGIKIRFCNVAGVKAKKEIYGKG